MRTYALLAISIGISRTATATDCTTPLGVPCMVVQFVNEQRSMLLRGINYRHSKSYQQIAYASDGSVASEYKFENIPLIGDPEAFAPTAQLYLRPSDRVVRIMHADRQYSTRD